MTTPPPATAPPPAAASPPAAAPPPAADSPPAVAATLRPRSPLRRFLGFLGAVRRTVLLLGVVVLVNRLAALVPPQLYQRLVDEGLGGRDLPRLGVILAGLAGLLVLNQVLAFGQHLLAARAQQGVLHTVRLTLYQHLQRLDLAFYRQHPTGGLLSRVLSDVGQVQNILSREALEVLASGVQLGVVGVLLLGLDPWLTLGCCAALPVLLGLVALFQPRLYRISRLLQQRREALSARIQENLAGIRLIQAMALEAWGAAATARVSDELRRNIVRAEAYGSGLNLLTILLTEIPLTLFVWGYGGWRVIEGELTLGGLLAFTQYVGLLYDPVIRILRFNVQLQTARAAVDRIYEVLDTPPAVVDPPGAVPLLVTGGEIIFDELTLAYDEGPTPALAELRLQLRPGEVLGLVGPSGAGKSTLALGLLRFLTPRHGRILVDGHDLATVSLASLRGQIGYVSQEAFLFSDTLAANIALGQPAATPDRIQAAARAAGAHDFIAQLPDGYQTVVGERGLGLSGGERQRIALARVFLQDPPLLVLDEATAALDARTEEAIQQALAVLVRGRTVLVIAHRFSTLKLCHRIAVLAGGRLVQLGSAAELAAQDGLYRLLLQAQLLESPDRDGAA